ncbi:GNAT family N-acetyltransferase [Xanthomonas phage RTH11]|nr:GNAT family N-acetyltransferase [Xanthomonas phage RTH11]
MQRVIEFRPITWDDLARFLHLEQCKINRDVDQDVRYMTYSMFCEQTVEGIYVDGQLAGFGRWDKRNFHLSNLYIVPEFRGLGLGRQYINERNIRTLYVMPHNHGAKALYAALGFIASYSNAPQRDFMVRPA